MGSVRQVPIKKLLANLITGRYSLCFRLHNSDNTFENEVKHFNRETMLHLSVSVVSDAQTHSAVTSRGSS